MENHHILTDVEVLTRANAAANDGVDFVSLRPFIPEPPAPHIEDNNGIAVTTCYTPQDPPKKKSKKQL